MSESKYKSVLLIDDSYIDNLINHKIITSNNFAEHVVVMDSAIDALAYLHQCIAEKKDIPDVIFLDIRMPEMNGFEFLKNLSLMEGIKEAGFKIFVLSSSLDPADLKQMKADRLVSKFINKPLTNKVLEDII